MSLILTSMALGLIPAWRASGWDPRLLLGCPVSLLLRCCSAGEVVDLLPAMGLVVLGFNGGIAMGMGFTTLASADGSHRLTPSSWRLLACA